MSTPVFFVFHETICPSCKKQQPECLAVTSSDDVSPRTPEAGDLAVCRDCRAPCVFVDAHTLRIATTEETQELAKRLVRSLGQLVGVWP